MLDDLLYSKSNFRAFSDFILYCALKWHISIADDRLIGEFIQAFEKLQKKYAHNLRSMEKYYDEIIRTIYYPQWLTKKDKQVIEDMYLFEQAYSLVKLAFKDKKRDSQERYFEHLKWTMEIVLRELPNPNINKIIIALLHDIQEDLPEYEDVIQRIYGDYIAKWVDILSKKERQEYLTEEEHDQYTTTHDQKLKRHISERAKERRNDDYFGHLNDLDDDILDVKFADRIHNLRDMSGVTKEKIQRKIVETKKYFLHVAEQRNPTAYTLMMNEINTLEQFLKTDKNT